MNGFVIRFSALKPDSDQKTAQLASIQFFLAKFPGANGLSKVVSFPRKSTLKLKTTKSDHKIPNWVKE